MGGGPNDDAGSDAVPAPAPAPALVPGERVDAVARVVVSDDQVDAFVATHPVPVPAPAPAPATAPAHPPTQTQSPTPPYVAFHERSPVTSTAAAGGVAGALLGMIFGLGPVTGAGIGSATGAVIASRRDDAGERARDYGRRAAETAQSVADHPLGQDVRRKVSQGLERAAELDERYGVTERVATATVAARGALERAKDTIEPRAQQLLERAKERDTYDVLGNVKRTAEAVDSTFGISVAAKRALDAISDEYKRAAGTGAVTATAPAPSPAPVLGRVDSQGVIHARGHGAPDAPPGV